MPSRTRVLGVCVARVSGHFRGETTTGSRVLHRMGLWMQSILVFCNNIGCIYTVEAGSYHSTLFSVRMHSTLVCRRRRGKPALCCKILPRLKDYTSFLPGSFPLFQLSLSVTLSRTYSLGVCVYSSSSCFPSQPPQYFPSTD